MPNKDREVLTKGMLANISTGEVKELCHDRWRVYLPTHVTKEGYAPNNRGDDGVVASRGWSGKDGPDLHNWFPLDPALEAKAEPLRQAVAKARHALQDAERALLAVYDAAMPPRKTDEDANG